MNKKSKFELAMKGKLDIVKVLVDHGANVNFQNKDGWNCLHFAAKEGKLKIFFFKIYKIYKLFINLYILNKVILIL